MKRPWLTLAVAALLSSTLHAHTNFITPSPRVNENIKNGPCGAPPGAAPVATYQQGATIQVVIHEFVKHAGYFGFAISNVANPTNDGQFIRLPSPLPAPAVNPYPNYFNPAIHAYDTSTPPGNRYTYTIQLPSNVSCDRCTLQVVQYMMDAGPNTPPSEYYSCADVRVVPTGGASPPAPAAPPCLDK